MLYHVRISVIAWPVNLTNEAAEAHTFLQTRGIRAMSQKHALDKALAYAHTLPVYADRKPERDWRVSLEAEIVRKED